MYCCISLQNNLFIIDSLDIPTEDPEYMRDLVKSRDWGLSILFVDDNHEVPQMFANSLNKIPEFNILPVFGESLLLYLGVLA